jgi:hypothetical protein
MSRDLPQIIIQCPPAATGGSKLLTKELVDKWLQDSKLVELEPGKYKPLTIA